MKKETIETVGHSKNEETITPSQKSFDPYEATLKCEQEEIQRRTEEEDQEMFSNICKQIRTSLKEILKLKMDKPNEWSSEVEIKRAKVLMLMLSLRKISRIQKVRVKDYREKSGEARSGVDGATLQLQNLLYEVSHLKKEVRKCLEFQSADKEIDLVPIDQFYLEAPENISCPEETVEDPHKQRLAQLHWELEQRRGQTQLFDKLTQEKERIASLINEQEIKLASLAPRINTILEATLPLQKALNLPLDAKREQQTISHLLPSPLYTMWVQATSYGEACDAHLSATIEGDVDAARKLIMPEDDTRTEASDSDNELDLQEENIQRKNRGRGEKKRSTDNDEIKDSSLKLLLALHPLHIALTVKTKDGNSILVEFFYAQTLRIVTTKCSLNLVDSVKPLLTDILQGENFLNMLYAGDTGITSPNPANEYQLQKLNLTTLSAEHIKLIGRPFAWAQVLCGLSFLTKEIEESASAAQVAEKVDVGEDLDLDDTAEELTIASTSSTPLVVEPKKQFLETLSWRVSAERMHQTISAIKRRLQARLSLHLQFQSLEVARVTSGIPLSPEMLCQRFPGKISSEFRSWKPVAWADYVASTTTEPFINYAEVNSDYLTFKALFERKPATLEALIAISPDYPNTQPLFALSSEWNGIHTAKNNPHIRQMESEVNVYWNELVSNRSERFLLLSLQLYRVAMCFDIFTEATSDLIDQNSVEKYFPKEKIFFRTARGPDRALPLKYLPKLGVFAQR